MSQRALALDGKRKSGQPVRTELVQTVQVLSNILKSSLGPVGLDKMLVDDIGDILVTNDGATILSRLEVEHPAAKMLVDLSKLQDDEVGDGTTSVVLLASELLKRANTITQHKIHPTNVIAGYKLACRESIKYIKDNLAIKTSSLGADALMNIARTSMSSKILSSDIEHFSKICTEVCPPPPCRPGARRGTPSPQPSPNGYGLSPGCLAKECQHTQGDTDERRWS